MKLNIVLNIIGWLLLAFGCILSSSIPDVAMAVFAAALPIFIWALHEGGRL